MALRWEFPRPMRAELLGWTRRAETAEKRLHLITKLHGPDPTGSWCGHCQNTWPCATWRLTTGDVSTTYDDWQQHYTTEHQED